MKKGFRTVILTCSVIFNLQPFYSHGQKKPDSLAINSQSTPIESNGQHHFDFDFEIGTWKTTLKRLLYPLTGSSKWIEYSGTTVVKKFGMVLPILWNSM